MQKSLISDFLNEPAQYPQLFLFSILASDAVPDAASRLKLDAGPWSPVVLIKWQPWCYSRGPLLFPPQDLNNSQPVGVLFLTNVIG